MANRVRATGVGTPAGPDGSVPLRYEIRDLYTQRPDQFNLFILTIRQFQLGSKDSLTSYYQLAGIHGMPFKAWDNVQGISDWDFGGYCTHSSVLFVPWHRPYLALFEQTLYAIAQDVAKQFPANLRSKYVTAASDLRLPFFDWAGRLAPGASEFPVTLSSAQITVVDVDGQTKSIDNPLYSFNFAAVKPDKGDLTGDWANFPATVRYPDSSGNSQDDLVARVLTNESASRRENVAMLLLSPSYRDFDAFTNNAWRGPGNVGTYSSLEDVHNEIHDETGGPGGHMGSLEVSAFDPLFWVHHCNVDRLWAIWQDLNPNSFITPQQISVANFTTEEGTVETQTSLLKPFWDKTGQHFWNSVQVKSTQTFSYAYPETQSWQYSSQDEYQQALRATVNQLYGTSVFQNIMPSIPKMPATGPVNLPPHPKKPTTGPAHSPAHQDGFIGAAVSHVKQVASEIAEAAHLSGPARHTSPSHHTLLAEGTEGAAGAAGAVAPEKRSGNQPTLLAGDFGKPQTGSQASLSNVATPKKYHSYVTNVRAIKHGLNQTFRIIVFLGEYNKDPKSWHTEYNVVGRVTMLGRSPKTKCGRCQDDITHKLVTTGTVPLTSALIQDLNAGRLNSLEPNDVAPYLAKNLHWRVTLFNGDEQVCDEVPGLKVSVACVPTTVGDDGIPTYDKEYQTLYQATAGKPAGLEDGEQA